MKNRSRIVIRIKMSLCLPAVLILLSMTVVPGWSAAISQELKMTIMNRMPVAVERGMVLQSAARAVENGYPEDRLAPVIEKSLDSHVSPDALSKMIDTLDAARGKGLPTQPYAEKIMEGLAKKVSEDRILAALKKVGERLEYSAAQAEKVEGKGDSSRTLIVRTSDAIAAGMNKRDIERVYETMAKDRINRKIEPEDIMEMVKAASGYGVDSGSVGDYAISLMKNKKADLNDIRDYLQRLAENFHRRGSGIGSGDAGDRHWDQADDETKDDGDDDGDDGGSDDGDDGGGDTEQEDEPGDEDSEPDDDESEEEGH
ncbi:MAG: hypothetical protein RRA15_06355 [bacterium]|nr:hypothetical protein [bacterium]MDT8366097.1 hypothetical protein [bacterium]